LGDRVKVYLGIGEALFELGRELGVLEEEVARLEL